MTTVSIRGVSVKFPFTPYEIQKNYMEKVIDCLENQQNGILESPTGTGKTLSLLCSSLAWLEMRQTQFDEQLPNYDVSSEKLNSIERDNYECIKVPTIIYASRTHSQLRQAMQEMKRTAYNHMKACVLGSREQMCINQEVIDEKDKSHKINLCRLKVKKKQCTYFNGVERGLENPDILTLNIIDMEDIVELGRCHDFCPYYMAKELKLNADIVFMPYNYLLDPRTTKTLGVQFLNSVVILDEAHNIEKVCEDATSAQIKSTDITPCIQDITSIIDVLLGGHVPVDEEIDFTLQQLRQLNEIFFKFKTVLAHIKLPNLSLEGVSFDGDYIYEILDAAGINNENFNNIIDLLEKITQFLSTTTTLQRSGYDLNIFSDLLHVAFYRSTSEFRKKIKECFKVHIIDEEPKRKFGSDWLSQSTPTGSCRVLSFWCFSPGFAMKMLMDQGIHCIILTSGTLAPLKPLISELEIDIGVKIENPHVVSGEQICVKVLTKGPDLEPLNSNYQNRNNPKYLQSLGLVISNLVRVIPHGVLIFFPSYFIMENCKNYWEQTGIWAVINQIKPIYVEPKDKVSFNNAMNDYYSKIQDPNYQGAIFMGVCRGKVSEGLDFTDINGRAVFITGLPYPPLKDPRIILKKKYLDFCNSRDREYLRGDEWYSLEATRAVNQAIGRVIRHKDDYGAIILLDSRFTNPRIKNNMSRWLQQHIENMRNFGETIRNLRLFFQNAKENLTLPKVGDSNIEFDMTDDFDQASKASPSELGLINLHKRKGENNMESPQKKLN